LICQKTKLEAVGMTENNYKSIYFVEEFSPLLGKINGKIIALTPKVCYQLDKENIPYQIYEDFYNMFERKNCTKGYNQGKMFWIGAFDDYLRSKLTNSLDKKLNFVRLYGYYIEIMIDQFIISSRNILSVLNKEMPSKVYLVVAPRSQEDFDWRLYNAKGDVTVYILQVICQKLGLQYFLLRSNTEKAKSGSVFSKLNISPFRIIRTLGRIAKGMHTQIIYLLLWLKRRKLKKQNKFRRIIISSEGRLGNLYKKAVKAGHQILYHTMYGPKQYLFFRKRKENEIKDFYIDDRTKLLWEKLGKSCIKEFNLLEWINTQAGVDISEVLTPRFVYFLQNVCPIISLSARRYEKIFKEKKIDYVVCQYKILPSDFGLMAAATLYPEVFSMHVEHGGGESRYHKHYFTELPANIYVTSSKEEAVFYSEFFNSVNSDRIEVVAAKGWIERYKHEAKKTGVRFFKSTGDGKLNKSPKKIYYVPTPQSIQRFASSYPLCWYHHFHRNLCEHFAKLPQYNFFIKGLSGKDWIFKPLLDFLNDLGAPNIFYKEGDLRANLRRADRIITDYPSTPTFEARLMRLPVLSLYHESVGVRYTAQEIYGKTLVSFREVAQMTRHIDKFLASNPEEYIIPVEDNFLTPTLLDVLEHKNGNIRQYD